MTKKSFCSMLCLKFTTVRGTGAIEALQTRTRWGRSKRAAKFVYGIRFCCVLNRRQESILASWTGSEFSRPDPILWRPGDTETFQTYSEINETGNFIKLYVYSVHNGVVQKTEARSINDTVWIGELSRTTNSQKKLLWINYVSSVYSEIIHTLDI